MCVDLSCPADDPVPHTPLGLLEHPHPQQQQKQQQQQQQQQQYGTSLEDQFTRVNRARDTSSHANTVAAAAAVPLQQALLRERSSVNSSSSSGNSNTSLLKDVQSGFRELCAEDRKDGSKSFYFSSSNSGGGNNKSKAVGSGLAREGVV